MTATNPLNTLREALDPEFLLNCARNIEDEFPYFAADLRKKAAAERAALAGTNKPAPAEQH